MCFHSSLLFVIVFLSLLFFHCLLLREDVEMVRRSFPSAPPGHAPYLGRDPRCPLLLIAYLFGLKVLSVEMFPLLLLLFLLRIVCSRAHRPNVAPVASPC